MTIPQEAQKIFQCLVVCTFLVELAAQSHAGASQTTCDELRNQMTRTFRQTYEKNVPANYLAELLPLWVESSLPRDCVKKGITLNHFNPSSTNDSGGPLGTLGPPGVIFTTSIKTKRKREADTNPDVHVGIERQKRSRSSSQNSEGIDDIPRDKRSTDNNDVDNEVGAKMSLSRQKRFYLNGFPPVTGGGLFDTLPADPTAPPREVTEGEIMMKNLLMFSRLQKARLASEYGGPGRTAGGLSADKPPIGGGMYGESYHGRRKRATASQKRVDAANLSRAKRFLFPFDPEGHAAGPDMFSLMAGTATDPNTGKRIEFGGDAMRNMMVNSYVSTLPFHAQPPPGKEPADFVQNMAPLWYFSRMQRLMSPVPSLHRYRENSIPRKPSYDQKRNGDGYYGDQLPGKKRRRRAAVPYEGEVITIGEIIIPIDLFKGREKALALMMKTSTKQPSYGKGFYGAASASPAKAPSKEVMSLFRQLLRQNQNLRNKLKLSPQGYVAPTSSWDLPPQSQPNNFGFQPSQWNTSPNSQVVYANETHSTKTGYIPPQPMTSSLYDPFYQQPLTPTPPTFYAKRPGTYAQIPPTETIIYAPITPRRPVDPFILIPATKDNIDPFQQSLDPFIPNPTTPPTTTTVTPLPPTAEPGRRKRSTDDANTSEDNTRPRFKRSEKHDGVSPHFSDPYFPGHLWNDLTRFYGSNRAPLISSAGKFSRNILSTSEISPDFPFRASHSGIFGIRPLHFSSENNFLLKPSHASPRGRVVNGDRLPWSSTAEHPAKKAATGSHSRIKRSPRENVDRYGGDPSYAAPLLQSASPLVVVPYSVLYHSHAAASMPRAYRTHRGGVLHGDRFPWSA
ncbi:unnamed protein product [Lymnaea stagnalis]|uniref:Uncharacterized protein n=1 Tax=Lymnaea stagnalis TaxID=6523 RepID=A0AAV2HTS3_LYMST